MKNKKGIMFWIALVVILICCVVIYFVVDSKLNQKAQEELKSELSHLFVNEALVPEADVYSHQKESDEKIAHALDNSSYTIENPYVLQNPYYISPLTAIVVFQTDKEEKVTLTVNGSSYEFEASKKHAIPVYGLIAGKQNTVTVTAGGKTKNIKLDVSNVEDDLKLDIEQAATTQLSNGTFIITTPSEQGLYGFNEKGELVWRLTESYSLAITELDNGHLLLGDSEYVSVSFSRKGLVEIDYLGKIYNVYDIDGGYHHDVIEMENGNYILGTTKIGSGTVNDYIIEIDPKTGKTVKSWSLVEIVDNVSKDFVKNLNNTTWGFNNSIYYDKATNSLLLSLRGRNSVMSIDYDSKAINWIFGDPQYWNEDFNKYLVTIEGGNYTLGGHSVALNKAGNIVMFDNGYDASSEEDTACAPYINAHSSGKEYKINGKIATLVSEFTDNNSFFSYAVSNYYEASNGNYLLLSGWEFPDGAMTPEGCTMNQVNEGLFSYIYELDANKNILFKASFDFGAYRVNKLNLYNKTNKNFNPTETKYYSTLDSTIFSEVNASKILDKILDAEEGDFPVELTQNLLSVSAVFQLTDEVKVLLVNENGTAYEYLIKESGYYLQPIVNLRGLEGTYAIFLVINDTYYNLNLTYRF